MKAFLILEDGHVFEGTSIGSKREIISEIVFNTSMTGYLEVLTDPSYAGQAVVMTYPLIGNYGICYDDMESLKPWPDGYIVRELSRMPSNFRCQGTIQDFLKKNDIPYTETTDLESVIGKLDILYMTRVQRERFFNEEDYLRLKDSYILEPKKLKNAKSDLCIMHPLPRVNEISVAVDDDPRACYFKQVLNGKYIRMALILKLLGVKV